MEKRGKLVSQTDGEEEGWGGVSEVGEAYLYLGGRVGGQTAVFAFTFHLQA